MGTPSTSPQRYLLIAPHLLVYWERHVLSLNLDVLMIQLAQIVKPKPSADDALKIETQRLLTHNPRQVVPETFHFSPLNFTGCAGEGGL
jgi:hypothetical protein